MPHNALRSHPSRRPGSGTVDHIFGYTGREHDAESHLQFNRARYYDAALGRWISEDPIGFAAGDANLSRYVGNGPTNATDPSGLITWGDFFGGVLDVAAGAAEGANQIIKAKDNPFVAADLALGLYQRGKESVEIGVQAGEMINDVHDDLPKAIIEGTLVGTAHAAGLADSYYSYEGEELCLNDGKLDSRKLTDRERVAGGINGAIAWSGLAGSIWRLPSWFRPRGLKPKPGWRSCFVAGTRVVIAMQHNDLAETDDSATPPKWYACVIAGVFGLTALGFERRRQRSEDERVGDKQKPARARRRVGEAGKQSAHPRRQDAHSDKPTGDRSGREAVFAAPSDESHALDAASTCLTQPKPIGNRPGHRHRHRTGVGLLVASLFAICCLGWFLTGSADKAPSDVRHRASSGRSHTTRAIESIRVGERVVGDAIRGDGENEFGDVDPATWRKLSLRAPRADGTVSHVELLRPVWWLAERGAAVGKTVHLDVRECSILGDAEVLSIAPCPPLAEGNGRVVTGTFRHPAAAIIDVHVDGLTAPIGTTPNHRFWSEDRQDYVAAGELQPGERVRTLAGLSRVDRIVPRDRPEVVYNLEIQVDHVYHVGGSGVLVHNAGDCPTPNGTPDNPVQLDPNVKPKTNIGENAAKGKASEQRVLDDIGETKNNKMFDTELGKTQPDYTNDTTVGEIKDAKRVTNTPQIQKEQKLAESQGKEHRLITGENTKVSKGVIKGGTKVERRTDLGPKKR